MGVNSILTDDQKNLLALFCSEKGLYENFILSGGTALAEFYLHHRLSEDLDFFSENEVDPNAILAFFKKHKKTLGYKTITYEQSFNRNLFFLKLPKETLKIEFTYYPFSAIQKTKPKNNLRIDSLLDIAVNKLFTIYQKSRARDYIDLYCMLKKEPWSMADLAKKARIKFDTPIDPLQLGSQLLQAKEAKDYPRMIKKISTKEWHSFFENEARKLGKSIF